MKKTQVVLTVKVTSMIMLIQILVFMFSSVPVYSGVESQACAMQADPPPWQPWSVTGTQRLVVICVEFSDASHSTNASIIQNRLGSMATYFHNISSGKISVEFNLISDRWMKLNNTMGYYGQGSGKTDLHGWDFIIDSVKAWEGVLNFSNYKYLTVIHAGEDQSSYPNQTELLWRQNYCNLGRISKRTIWTSNGHYDFWGLAYDSEFEEWGLLAHEFAHGLGVPDLYVENESLGIDALSLMARGDRNGSPEGSCPAPLDAFSMYMLGWSNPEVLTLNSTGDTVMMVTSTTVFKTQLSDSEYCLIEVKEKSGYDENTVPSTSVIVYIVDDARESAKGIVDVLTGGIVAQGQIYSDTARDVFVSFLSFDSSTHVATVVLSAQLFFVSMNIPDSIEWLFTASGQVQVFDANNNPGRYVALNITVDESSPILRVTDKNGKADFPLSFGLGELGNHTVRVTSPSMLAGETERVIIAVFPWQILAITLLSIALVVLGVKYLRRARYTRATPLGQNVWQQGG